MKPPVSPSDLDRLLHEPARLSLSLLLDGQSADFAYLKKSLGLTDGNLLFHLRALIEAGHVSENRARQLTKRLTFYELTPQGQAALSRYRECMIRILSGQGAKPEV
jgi:DNA-binding MarR family transcriptional regulator